MRTHIQGFALLGLLLAALWGMTRLAAPTLSEAFGENGAVVAESAEDHVELTIETETVDPELTDEELTRLQFQLALAGFLDVNTDVDGLWGAVTRGAIADAAAEWGLDDPTDREILDYTDQLFADSAFFDSP
jgi:hypothetical protein